MWPAIVVRVRVNFTRFRDVCGTAVLAEQVASLAVRQAMLSIHVEIVLAEQKDEFPHGAVVASGDWGPVSVETFDYIIDLFPELLPWQPSCYSWFSLFVQVAVVQKPRLEVIAVDDQRAPRKDVHGPFFCRTERHPRGSRSVTKLLDLRGICLLREGVTV